MASVSASSQGREGIVREGSRRGELGTGHSAVSIKGLGAQGQPSRTCLVEKWGGGCLRVEGRVKMGTALCQGVILASSPDFHIHSSCLHGGANY